MVKARSWKRSKPSLPAPYLIHVTAAVRRRKEEETKRLAEEEALKRAGTEIQTERKGTTKGSYLLKHLGLEELSEEAVKAHIAEVEKKLDGLHDEKHQVILRLKHLLKDEETRKQAERAREEREAAERVRQQAVAASSRKTLFSPAAPGAPVPGMMSPTIQGNPGPGMGMGMGGPMQTTMGGGSGAGMAGAPPMHRPGGPGGPPYMNRGADMQAGGRGKPLHVSSPGMLNSRPPMYGNPNPNPNPNTYGGPGQYNQYGGQAPYQHAHVPYSYGHREYKPYTPTPTYSQLQQQKQQAQQAAAAQAQQQGGGGGVGVAPGMLSPHTRPMPGPPTPSALPPHQQPPQRPAMGRGMWNPKW